LRLSYFGEGDMRSHGCAFFMAKESFMPEESGRDKKEQEEKQEVIEIQAVGVPERKALGEAVEAAFLAKASMLGIWVSKPWGDSRPYDFIVDCGIRRLWRVQVKCATSYRGTRCETRGAGSGELYTEEDIDFLAAYVIPEDFWYVVPVEAFAPRATVHFNYGPLSEGMFEIYRETWCLLACSERERRRTGVPKRCRCEEMPVRCVVCPKKGG
jgi:PD-(D/E)XK endonuclease